MTTPTDREAIARDGEHRLCPWCGGQPVLVHPPRYEVHYRAGCGNDRCVVKPFAKGTTIENAWAAWESPLALRPAPASDVERGPVAWMYEKHFALGGLKRVVNEKRDNYAVGKGWTESPLYALTAAPSVQVGGSGRFDMTPEWCVKMAELEEGYEIGAGVLHPEAKPTPDALEMAREVLAGTLAYLDGGQETGTCMCGDLIDSHTIGSGHSPVDSGLYYADQLRTQINEALAALRAGEA